MHFRRISYHVKTLSSNSVIFKSSKPVGGSRELIDKIVPSTGVAQFLRHDIASPATGVKDCCQARWCFDSAANVGDFHCQV